MELLRLLARQRLLKVGEKGIMTIGTKEAVEREANNLALLLQKHPELSENILKKI